MNRRAEVIATLADLDADTAAECVWTHEAIEIPAPPLAAVPYRDLVAKLCGAAPFSRILGTASAARPLVTATERWLGRDIAPFLERLESLLDFVARLLPGGELKLAMRNFFVPADLLWHHDLTHADRSVRLLWPLGRLGGLRVVPTSNVDAALHGVIYARERPLVQRLDRRYLATKRPLADLWRHRPVQLSQLLSGRYPFIRDPREVFTLATDAISVHRVRARHHAGTLHATSAANVRSPGLQLVITSRS